MKLRQSCGKALAIKLLQKRDPLAGGAGIMLPGRMSSSAQLLPGPAGGKAVVISQRAELFAEALPIVCPMFM